MPVSPTTRNVAGVSGLTGNPVVICPSSAAWPTCAAGTPNVPGDVGDDRQDAEIEGVGIEEQAERHRHDRERDRNVRRERGGTAPTAACAMAASIPLSFMMPVKAPAASRMPAIISAALACASIRARWSAGSG